MPENKFLKLFQSTEETDEPEISQINGRIPDWLNGSLIRTGPGKWDFGDFTMNHYLDGFAILSKFSIDGLNQTVKFEKKFLQSDAYKGAIAAKKPVVTEFGTRAHSDPNKSLFSRLLSACLPIELTDNDTVNMFQIGTELFATSETCFFRQVDPCTLETGVKHDVNKCFGVNVASAHPLTDDTGTTWNIGFSVLLGLKYHIIRIPSPTANQTGTATTNALNQSKILATIPSSFPTGLLSYNHSFAMTKNYIIFVEQPHVMNIAKAAKSYVKGSPCYKDWVEWRPELKNRFHLIEKSTGKVSKTEFMAKDNFFFLHVINAYEENNQIILDLNCYKDSSFFDDTYLKKLRDGKVETCSKACGHRFVIPNVEISDEEENVDLVTVKSNATAIRLGDSIILCPEIITEYGFEMPVLNKKYMGMKYSYFYASGTYAPSQFSNAIIKFNARNKETILWKGTKFQFPGEPQFIPNPSGTTEDDGVLVVAVTDSQIDRNDFLLILDSKKMTELGTAQFCNQLCQGIHGIFLPEVPVSNKLISI